MLTNSKTDALCPNPHTIAHGNASRCRGVGLIGGKKSGLSENRSLNHSQPWSLTLSLHHHQGIEHGPCLPRGCSQHQAPHVLGQLHLVVVPNVLDGSIRTVRRWRRIPGGRQHREKLLPTEDHHCLTVQPPHGDQALELGRQGKIVNEEQHPHAVRGIAECLLQRVPRCGERQSSASRWRKAALSGRGSSWNGLELPPPRVRVPANLRLVQSPPRP